MMDFNELKNNLNTLNRESRIDELEKLRKEIVECAFEGYDYGIQGMILELDNVLKEIDNRIERLKE